MKKNKNDINGGTAAPIWSILAIASGKAINAKDGPDPTTSLTSTPRSVKNVNVEKDMNFERDWNFLEKCEFWEKSEFWEKCES